MNDVKELIEKLTDKNFKKSKNKILEIIIKIQKIIQSDNFLDALEKHKKWGLSRV